MALGYILAQRVKCFRLHNEMIQFMDWSIYSFDNIVILAPLSRKLDVKYVGLIKVNVTRI